MSINKEIEKLLISEIKRNQDLLSLREILITFKDEGMSKNDMLDSLEILRTNNDEKIEEVLLELMDFVTGFCNPRLVIFKE